MENVAGWLGSAGLGHEVIMCRLEVEAIGGLEKADTSSHLKLWAWLSPLREQAPPSSSPVYAHLRTSVGQVEHLQTKQGAIKLVLNKTVF